MSKRYPITKDGLTRLKQELVTLKKHDRPKIIKAIAEARAHGDLSENAEYHAAREKQGFIEAKILELEDIAARAEVILLDKTKNDIVSFGTTVEIEDEESEIKKTYTIVSYYEANASKGLISVDSPLAKSMLGKKINDSFEFSINKGNRYYQILSIKH